jgi:Uma2 family endonuclease
MNTAHRQPRMTREQFFDWAQVQRERYEFDGFSPVAMTGGNLRHGMIGKNIIRALDARLRGGCRSLGPDAGVRTVGDAVRYPDAVVSGSPFDDLVYEVPSPIVVFDVVSPTSGHMDRIVKVQEYRAVASVRYYVIVEYASVKATVHKRDRADVDWTTTEMTGAGTLHLPEIGVLVPVAEFYVGTHLAIGDAAGGS